MVASSKTGERLDARDPARIREDIARTRAEIAASMEALSAEVAARADWREWVRRRPGLVLGAAFAVGFSLGCRD